MLSLNIFSKVCYSTLVHPFLLFALLCTLIVMARIAFVMSVFEDTQVELAMIHFILNLKKICCPENKSFKSLKICVFALGESGGSQFRTKFFVQDSRQILFLSILKVSQMR